MTDKLDEVMAQVILLLRHVRNLHELGPHAIRAEATQAEIDLEAALGSKRYRELEDHAFAHHPGH